MQLAHCAIETIISENIHIEWTIFLTRVFVLFNVLRPHAVGFALRNIRDIF